MIGSPWIRVFLSFMASCVICLASVFLALQYSDNPADAGRGGALVVALSFAFIFPNYTLADKILNITGGKHKALWEKILDKERNLILSTSAVTGTIFWGFGDWVYLFFN